MDVVGEVEWCGAARQIDDLAAWRQRVQAISEQIALDAVDEIAFGMAGTRRIEHAARPFNLALVINVARAAFLVAPMGCNTEFSMLVHGARADLNLQGFRFRAYDGSVDGAVMIVLRSRNIVIEFAGHIAPQAVHCAERCITVGHGLDHDAHRTHIEQLLEGQVLSLHFPPDAVDVFGSAVDAGLEASRGEHGIELCANPFDVLFASDSAFRERCGDPVVVVGFEVTESEVLQLPLDAPDA